jgi:hypothetical protein
MALCTSGLALCTRTIISPKNTAMKVRTYYPEHPLPENEWYKYIYNLLTQPHEQTAISQESLLDSKRRADQARRVEHAGSAPAKNDQRGAFRSGN